MSCASRAVWRPPPDALATTNVGRFLTGQGLGGFDELVRQSIAEPEWFWPAVIDFLGIPFTSPFDRVLDTTDGIEWAKWFTGGRLNLAHVCVDRWAAIGGDRPAVVWEGEDGTVRRWTYGELRREADGLAGQLQAGGVGAGDAVGIFLPMIPETVAALVAVMKLGARFLPLFSGYGPEAVAGRLRDAEAKALVTADGTYRRGRRLDMHSVAAKAIEEVPSVETVVVVPRLAGGRAWARADEPFTTEMVDSEHVLFLAYTSGTTGRPKASVAVHAGFGVKVAEEVAFQFDVRREDVLFWFTDMGWIMGPWEVVGTLANGATLALYEGAPDWPGPDRLWSYVERHGVTVLGISPTLIRALMPAGDAAVQAHDLSRLRILGSTGEPWNERPWRWYFEVVGGGRCPVINISGGTEVGACFLSPHPVQPIKPMSLGGPALGMAVDVFGDDGRPLRGGVGELVCKKPWPGMTRGLYKDPDRYLATYWSTFPGVWRHGDWASIDDDGEWFLHGRSDDTIKVAGKRIGPAEVESVLVAHPDVIEAAAVGIPDEVKGEKLWAYVVVAPAVTPTEDLRAELGDLVAERLGRSFRPAAVRFTTGLPKTRNAKVLRRAIRATALGQDAGDLSSLEDAASIEAVRTAR
ncbi:MAG: AMP-binding protein [Actinobacteria bacterium]|nr:AMP-binding protein [Actinomycetota bacterium]MBW3649146.1 AMP-binding protein [Actinomycetota bacterium]